MKILFTGGGTGGHFYPIIAVAQEVRDLALENKLIEPKLYFMSDDEYNSQALADNEITFIPVKAGKVRRYFSILNFFDLFKTGIGMIQAFIKMYQIYPDVVFGKGGFASFPPLFAARILRIPVIIHESDSKPGRVNLWAGKFAQKIAVSYPEAAKFFPAEKVALTGNPIRKEILIPAKSGAFEFLNFDKTIPVIFILGGSLGAMKINDLILDILPTLVKKYQIIHQVGKNNFDDAKKRADFILENNPLVGRYKIFKYLDDVAMKMSAGATSLIISRAGSTIFEIANWGIPSIIIPIPEEISHDQRSNAITYARAGAAEVIEEKNLEPSILLAEIDNLLENKEKLEQMKIKSLEFSRPDAAKVIATALLKISLQHET
ncbi:MAG: UDP-N-acetylglucosamine--N-acetylmuramyl-(pentapeptide) pyrophosphoryl-undecaprenol N-acetylglucosamine transferase [Candidatus Vogelbacteria bacterium]|nr:UDP-N-acetylglucosamine--N-acetylmuramyl-(pentapeptide) pyrophosphoryl-undecaprenol N-acetylglucosamine transferase [Candidatus Vogelbacteria bacterium]